MYSPLQPTCILRKSYALASARSQSFRPFSLSSLRSEIAVPEKVQSRGVPLAFDLGGINISQKKTATHPRTPRISLSQRLGAKLKPATHADTSPITRAAQQRVSRSKNHATSQHHARPDTPQTSRPPQKSLRTMIRPVDTQDTTQVSNTKQVGKRPGVTETGAQRIERQGQSEGRGRINGGAAPRRKKTQAKQKPSGRNVDPSNRNVVNEEYIGGLRTFDEKGLIKMKEPGVVPKPQVLRSSSLRSVFGVARNSPTWNDSASQSTLQPQPYIHHSPPGDAGRGILGVVDNAELALSRVRDLDIPHRREALGIVTKLAATVKSASVEKRA